MSKRLVSVVVILAASGFVLNGLHGLARPVYWEELYKCGTNNVCPSADEVFYTDVRYCLRNTICVSSFGKEYATVHFGDPIQEKTDIKKRENDLSAQMPQAEALSKRTRIHQEVLNEIKQEEGNRSLGIAIGIILLVIGVVMFFRSRKK